MLKVVGSKIQNESINFVPNTKVRKQSTDSNYLNTKPDISFQGTGSSISKQGWFALRNLSDKMQNASEITNAFIAAIGTGIIAPLIILGSPGKGDKEDKDKKFFQAIRQPLSAGLALAFQLPATMAVNKFFNMLAYEKKAGIFNDKKIGGSLIPDKKYIKKQITNEELHKWTEKFDIVSENGNKSLKQELEEKIKKEYAEVGLDINEEKLAKKVEKRKINFLKDKIADSKHDDAIKAKIEELVKSGKDKEFKIEDIDLVNEDYKALAKEQRKAAYEALEANKNLSVFDKFARLMGFSTKKIKELETEQKQWAKENGLEILRADEAKKLQKDANAKTVFNDADTRFKQYIENIDKETQKFFGNKKFWFSLLVNLFMVSASCYALNWAHPRFKELIDKFSNKDVAALNEQPQTTDIKKVEVEA